MLPTSPAQAITRRRPRPKVRKSVTFGAPRRNHAQGQSTLGVSAMASSHGRGNRAARSGSSVGDSAVRDEATEATSKRDGSAVLR